MSVYFFRTLLIFYLCNFGFLPHPERLLDKWEPPRLLAKLPSDLCETYYRAAEEFGAGTVQLCCLGHAFSVLTGIVNNSKTVEVVQAKIDI